MGAKKKICMCGVVLSFVIAMVPSLLMAEEGYIGESPILIKSYAYNATVSSPSEPQVQKVINNAKKLGFWIRIGVEPKCVYYKGAELCTHCSFFNESEFLAMPILYAYVDDNSFLVRINKTDYMFDVASVSPDKCRISINVYSNVSTIKAKKEITNTLLQLEIVNDSSIPFTFTKCMTIPHQMSKIPSQSLGNTAISSIFHSNKIFIATLLVCILIIGTAILFTRRMW